VTAWRTAANPMSSRRRFEIGRIVSCRTGANRHLSGYGILNILQFRCVRITHLA
jgi:hypothetical protein